MKQTTKILAIVAMGAALTMSACGKDDEKSDNPTTGGKSAYKALFDHTYDWFTAFHLSNDGYAKAMNQLEQWGFTMTQAMTPSDGKDGGVMKWEKDNVKVKLEEDGDIEYSIRIADWRENLDAFKDTVAEVIKGQAAWASDRATDGYEGSWVVVAGSESQSTEVQSPTDLISAWMSVTADDLKKGHELNSYYYFNGRQFKSHIISVGGTVAIYWQTVRTSPSH